MKKISSGIIIKIHASPPDQHSRAGSHIVMPHGTYYTIKNEQF